MRRTTPRILVVVALLSGCSAAEDGLPRIAESYVRTALALEWRDPGYVDAYYGPAAWEEEAAAAHLSLHEIGARVDTLLQQLEGVPEHTADEALRRRHLEQRLRSMRGRVDLLSGAEMSFDEESLALFGTTAPQISGEALRPVLDEIEALLPGEGSALARYRSLKESLAVPRERLDAVLRAALAGCRAETLRHISLPEGEQVEIRYVTGRPWLAYHRYLGGYRSIVEVSTDFLITIDDVLDVACHEAYPGHHVHHVLLEREMVVERGWIEYSLSPLYGPQSFVAEGTARLGIAMAFPGEARERFEREVLFPLAGIAPGDVEAYPRVRTLVERLAPAGDEGARRYLDGRMDRPSTAAWLEKHALLPGPEATLGFANRYRSYLITYNAGEAAVRAHLEARGGTPDRPDRRWEVYGGLLSSPWLPSELAGSRPRP